MKAQAALEFLMTYGWMILVITSLVGGMFYYGWRNPDILVQQECTIKGSLSCQDYIVEKSGSLNYNGLDQSSIKIVLKNLIGKTIRVLSINATLNEKFNSNLHCYNNSKNTNPKGLELNYTGEKLFFLNCSAKLPDLVSKAKFNIAFNYYFNGTNPKYNYTNQGYIIANVQ